MITIDGISGAGKSTQSNKLGKLLNIPVCTMVPIQNITNEYYQMVVGTNPRGFSYILRDLSIIRAMQLKPHGRTKQLKPHGWHRNIVVDNFFRSLADFHKSDEVETAIDIFRKSLCIDGGMEPAASFYLDVPRVVSVERLIRRNNPPWFKIGEVKSPDAEKGWDIAFQAFWQHLASKLPYLHIIDGTQAEEVVTAEILDILLSEKIIDESMRLI